MFVGCHNHTDHSNYRLLDCINKVDEIIKYSRELGHKGIAITDHESLGNHVNALHVMRDLKKNDPEYWKDYKLILGNEIYLCSRKRIQEDKERVFPHFILIAKNENGHKCLRELSSIAYCENSFTHVMLRTPTFYDTLFEKLEKYKGDIIGSTACAGGIIPKKIMEFYNENPDNVDLSQCVTWINKMNKVFGEGNFFLELQPSIQSEQIIINKYLIELSKLTGVPYIITTDAHYLKKEDAKIHEAFIQSQDGDREVADFYGTTYIMSEEEIHSYLDSTIGYDAVQLGINNTMLIYDMVEEYSLDKPLNIPYIPDDESDPDPILLNKYKDKIELFDYFAHSDYPSDRHLVREIIKKFEERPEEFQNKESYEATQTCLESIKLASDKQNTPWSAYLLQTKALIQLCWDSGTLVGAGRGSGVGFFLLYVLDITQINPLREDVKTYHWRFLNPERVSPLDIDTDIIGEMKDTVVKNLQEKYGGYHHVCKVQTISTSAPKKSIQIACRGLGYTPEEGFHLSSFIASERGITFTLHQTFYGDEEIGLAPNHEFANLMTVKYPDVWKIAQKIEGLCVGTGQHAGGVILSKEDFDDSTALMKTKGGDVTTQFDLHACEDCGLIKWDILAIDALGKMKIALDLLLEDGLIEWQGSLRATYDKYLGVYSMDRDSDEIWDAVDNHKILSLFQFEKKSGYQAIELGKPRSLEAMSALNSVMRLMAQEQGGEIPLQRYARMRENISEWYDEMDKWGLTKEEQKWLEQYALKNYGLLPNQENFMVIVQDPMIGGYSLLWADKLRKAIAKKNPKAFNELQEEFFENVKTKGLSEKLCNYVWSVLICMSKGYGFNTSHTLAYSVVALQEANLAIKYPNVYWNCACMISDTLGTVDYGKNAASMSRMEKDGVKIVAPDINKSKFDFHPDKTDNSVLFGFKPMNGIGDSVAKLIISHQPYSSMDDFYDKMKEAKKNEEGAKFGDSAMISLIKADAFRNIETDSKEELMKRFVKRVSSPLKKLSWSNIDVLDSLGIVDSKEMVQLYKDKEKIFKDKKNIVRQEGKSPATAWYKIEDRELQNQFAIHYQDLMDEKNYEFDGSLTEGDAIAVKKGAFEKAFEKLTAEFKEKVLDNEENLNKINEIRFKKYWNEKIGPVEKWSFDSCGYYFNGDHELKRANEEKAGISNYFKIPENPEILNSFNYRGKVCHRYRLQHIYGTVVSKDASHSTINLLTPDGCVTVKLYKGEFIFYDKTSTTIDNDGKKVIVEPSWFEKGTLLYVTGYKSNDQFVGKTYSDLVNEQFAHVLQKITSITEDGDLVLQKERIAEDGND